MATIDLSHVRYYVVAILSSGAQLYLDEVAENIAWEENEKEFACRINLTIRDIPYNAGRLSQVLELGTILMIYADWGEGRKEICRGTIWDWEHSRVNDDAIVVTGYDLLYSFQKSKDNRYYPKGKTTTAIVSDILSAWGATVGKITVAAKTHEKITYKAKTIAAMITETLDDAKKLGGSEYVVRAEEGKVNVLKVGDNSPIYCFSASTNLVNSKDKFSMTDLITRVLVLGKEDKDGRVKVEATVDGLTQFGILQDVQNMGSSTIAEAKTKAEETIKEKGKPKRTITFTAADMPAVRKGDKVRCTTDTLDGFFIVKTISHNATSMTMQMEVTPADE